MALRWPSQAAFAYPAGVRREGYLRLLCHEHMERQGAQRSWRDDQQILDLISSSTLPSSAAYIS